MSPNPRQANPTQTSPSQKGHTQTPNSQASFSIAVIISGTGTNLKAILDYISAQQLPIEVNAVLSNNKAALGLDIARASSIKTLVIEPKDYADREAYDQELAKAVDALEVDLIVLAGYMRILSPAFVKQFTGRLINIHPSLLPKYKGLNTYERVLSAGDSQHGCSIHLVTEELDGGPIIAQAAFNIEACDTEDTLQDKTRSLEYQLYPRVIEWISEGRIQWKHQQLHINPPISQEELPQLTINTP